VAKLGGHQVLAELVEEAEQAADGDGEISELTRQQVELAVTAAARKDEAFGQVVSELVAQLRAAERAAGGNQVTADAGSTVFAGDAKVRAESGGLAFGQVAGDVYIDRGSAGPSAPVRPSH
jgi:hypothetical protein